MFGCIGRPSSAPTDFPDLIHSPILSFLASLRGRQRASIPTNLNIHLEKIMKKIIVSLFLGLSFAALGQTTNVSSTTSHLSKKEARSLEMRASTPQEHSQLADYYRARAAKEGVESQKHATEAAYFKLHPSPLASKHPFIYGTEAHCLWVSSRYAKSATKSEALLRKHEQLTSALQAAGISRRIGE